MYTCNIKYVYLHVIYSVKILFQGKVVSFKNISMIGNDKQSGLIREVAFGGCGLIREVTFGGCGLIREVAFGKNDLIRRGLLYKKRSTVFSGTTYQIFSTVFSSTTY